MLLSALRLAPRVRPAGDGAEQAPVNQSVLPLQTSFHFSLRGFLWGFLPPLFLLTFRLFSQKQNHVVNTVTGSFSVASPVEVTQQCGKALIGSSKNLKLAFKTC